MATKKAQKTSSRRNIEENAMNAKFRTLSWAAAFALVATFGFTNGATAQLRGVQSAGDKITGAAYWPARASTRHIESARGYAQEFQTYVQRVPQPEPSVVRDIKTELGRYLDEGQKHLTAMKKELANDTETVAAIESIQKDLAKAVEHNKAMITCCENQKFDKIATMACCTDLVKQLDKVHADHVALMRKLGGTAAPATK
jgi:hypothetical protein